MSENNRENAHPAQGQENPPPPPAPVESPGEYYEFGQEPPETQDVIELIERKDRELPAEGGN